jgi:hypothetical protein
MSLTNNLLVGSIFPWAHVDKVKEDTATSEAMSKVFDLGELVDDSSFETNIGEPFNIGIHAGYNLGVSWNRLGVHVDVLGHMDEQAIGGLLATGVTSIEQSILELDGSASRHKRRKAARARSCMHVTTYNHAIGVDENNDEGITLLHCG